MRIVRLGIVLFIICMGIFFLWKFFPHASFSLEQTDTRPLIVTTIFPLYDIAKQVGGDTIRVELILPPGGSEHTFEPTPKAQRAIEDADIIFSIGHGLDNWLYNLTSDPSKILPVDSGIALKEDKEIDPHYWLTLENGALIASFMAVRIGELIPEQTEEIRLRTEAYLVLLASTDRDLKDRLSHLVQKKIVTFHDAWAYFAEAYGLEIVGTFEPTAGREPTPQYLFALKEIVVKNHLSALYAEPQFSSRGIESFIKDYDLTLAVLDPLGGGELTSSYIELITYNVETILHNQK